MPLSNLVYTAGQAPNLVGPGLQVVNMRVDPYKALSQGYDDQQKRNLALQQHREAKLKADLATALYPQQSQLQQALLQAKLNAINNPTSYTVPPSAVAPINTRGGGTTNDGTGDNGPLTTPGAHDVSAPTSAPFPYQSGGNPLQLQPTPTQTFPGVDTSLQPGPIQTAIPTANANPYGDNPIADISDYLNSDFLPS